MRLTYGHEKNDWYVQDHFALPRALLDEFEVYQPLTIDIIQMRQYREELAVVIYLFNLTPELSSQIRGQILGANSVSDL